MPSTEREREEGREERVESREERGERVKRLSIFVVCDLVQFDWSNLRREKVH